MKKIKENNSDFPSLLSAKGFINLPYSGIYCNPGYKGISNIVHAYDIGDTLIGAKNRDEEIRKILGISEDAGIKSVLFNDSEMTKRISQAQEDGIAKGLIQLNSLDGVVDQLNAEKSRKEDVVLITVGTYQMARSFIHGANLGDYVSGLVTSEEANTGNKKSKEIFIRMYTALKVMGKTIVDYCDNSEKDAIEAVNASNELKGVYGTGFRVYLVDKNAAESKLGINKNGYFVIRSIADKYCIIQIHMLQQKDQTQLTLRGMMED